MRGMFLAFLIQNNDQNTIHSQRRGIILAKANKFPIRLRVRRTAS
jgi:hypothetical protein